MLALKSKKTCCFGEGSTEITIALHASKENIVRRLYEEKSIIKKPIKGLRNFKESKRCIIGSMIKISNLS